MKTPLAALAFAAAALCAATPGDGSALAQTRPQTPAPRTGVAAPPPAVGTIPAGQGQGQPPVADSGSNSLPRGHRMHKPFYRHEDIPPGGASVTPAAPPPPAPAPVSPR